MLVKILIAAHNICWSLLFLMHVGNICSLYPAVFRSAVVWRSWVDYGPAVDSASNRNEYQKYFLEGLRRMVRRADNLTTCLCWLSWNLGAWTSWNSRGLCTECFPFVLLHIWDLSFLCIYRGADKSLARPTSRRILFDGENISFDARLDIYIYIYIYIVRIFLQLWL
jgi:hypothetical protein